MSDPYGNRKRDRTNHQALFIDSGMDQPAKKAWDVPWGVDPSEKLAERASETKPAIVEKGYVSAEMTGVKDGPFSCGIRMFVR